MLVGTDFSDAATWAVIHAAEFAQKLNYSIDLVHVLADGDSTGEAKANQQLDETVAKIREEHNVMIDCRVCSGDAATVMHDLSEETDYVLVAVGYSGKTGMISRFGSVASKVVRQIDKPILVLVPGHHVTGPVVGCIDFSGQTDKINFWTHLMASIRNRPPVFTHVAISYEMIMAGTPDFMGMGVAGMAMSRMGESEGTYCTRLEDSLRERLGADSTEEVVVLLSGAPAHAIDDFVEQRDASLVVLGRKGHDTLASKLVGTTAEYLTAHSGCSTLVIP